MPQKKFAMTNTLFALLFSCLALRVQKKLIECAIRKTAKNFVKNTSFPAMRRKPQKGRRTGYSAKTAYSIGAENLIKYKIKPEIQKYIKNLTSGHKKYAYSNRWRNARVLTEVMKNSKVSRKDRIRAAENLAKRQGVDRPQYSDNEQMTKLDELCAAIEKAGGDLHIFPDNRNFRSSPCAYRTLPARWFRIRELSFQKNAKKYGWFIIML